LSNEFIQRVQTKNPGHLIAIDANVLDGRDPVEYSCRGYLVGSVQKCLGSGGLAVMVLSPKAMESIYRINERAHYNSLLLWQT